jgi:hypothetical protein
VHLYLHTHLRLHAVRRENVAFCTPSSPMWSLRAFRLQFCNHFSHTVNFHSGWLQFVLYWSCVYEYQVVSFVYLMMLCEMKETLFSVGWLRIENRRWGWVGEWVIEATLGRHWRRGCPTKDETERQDPQITDATTEGTWEDWQSLSLYLHNLL